MPEPANGRTAPALIPGLYEHILTRRIARLEDQLHDHYSTRALLPAEAPQYLTDHVAPAIARALRAWHWQRPAAPGPALQPGP